MSERSIAFMDESSILGGSTQRFFSLGLMKAQSLGPFSDAAHRVYDRAVSSVPGAGPHFEFQFNSVTANSLSARSSWTNNVRVSIGRRISAACGKPI